MIICTCGERFKAVKTGQAVITPRGLYACDVLECPACVKRVLDMADCPLAVGADVDAAADDFIQRGKTVYGR